MPDTLAERLTAWRTLAEGLKSRLEEVAFIKADHAELAGFVQQIDALMHAVRRPRGPLPRSGPPTAGRRGTNRRAVRPHGVPPQGHLRQARQRPARARLAARRLARRRRKEEETGAAGARHPPTQPPAPAPASAQEEPTAG